MENDSKESSSDDSVAENIIRWDIKRLLREKQINDNKIRYLEELIAIEEASQIPPSDAKSAVSPMSSRIHEPQDLSKDSFEHLPNSPISIESLNQSEVIYDPNEALHQASVKECNHISRPKTLNDETQSARTGTKFKAPKRFTGPGGNYVSKSKESANPKFRYKKGSKHAVQSIKASCHQSEVISEHNKALHQASIKESNDISRQKTLNDEIQSARTGTKFKATESSTESGGSSVSKSKESANKKFRYKKGSKHAVQSIEASCQETTVKPFEEASGSSEKKDLEPQSITPEIRISPAMKRKLLDLDESCFTMTSKLLENRAVDNDDVKIPKKLKLHDDEKARKQCLSRTALLSQKKYEGSDSSKYIYQSRTYRSRNESEQLPSSSNVKKVIGNESPLFRGNNDFSCSERVESCVTTGREDMAENKSKESTSTSVWIDEPLIDRGECSLKSASDSSEFFASDSSEFFASGSSEFFASDEASNSEES